MPPVSETPPGLDSPLPEPPRFDPWSGNRVGGIRWFAASTLIHAGLLVLFGEAVRILSIAQKAGATQIAIAAERRAER